MKPSSKQPTSEALRTRNATARRRPIPLSRKFLFGMLPTVVLFVLAEVVLALLGTTPNSRSTDPLQGFSEQLPLFEEYTTDQGEIHLRTSVGKLPWFNFQEFSKSKSLNTKRVFCLGGSTTYGRPYSDLTSYSSWLRELLPGIDSSQHWEVINAGGVSYASYRVAAVMQELLHYDPDVFIIYSAHNEFLERRTYESLLSQPQWFLSLQGLLSHSRTYSLIDNTLHPKRNRSLPGSEKMDWVPAEVDERLNHTIGPTDYHSAPRWSSQVFKHYELNLRRMIDLARQAGAEIVWITPASNERDCSPFKSEWPPDMGTAERDQMQQMLQISKEQRTQGDLQTSKSQLLRLLELAPDAAEVHFQLGKVLFELEEFADAESCFLAAIDSDVCPLRAGSTITSIIHQCSQQRDVGVVDFDKRLHAQCAQELGHRCLGNEYFVDHVHPTIEVHELLAHWIVEKLQSLSLVGGESIQAPASAPLKRQVHDAIYAKIDNNVHGVAMRNLAKVLHWSGKFSEAVPCASDALDLLPNDPESRYLLAECLKNIGQFNDSLIQFELLFQETEYARAYIPFAELLIELGKFERAKGYLLSAVLSSPENAYAYYLLAQTHYELKEYAFAYDAIRRANELYPDEPKTIEMLHILEDILSRP